MSKDFRILPKISGDFPKIVEIIKSSEKHFSTVSEIIQKISEDFPKILTPFYTVSEFFRNFRRLPKICQNFNKLFKFLKNEFEAFPKFSEIPGDFRALPQNFYKFSEDLGMG